MLLVLNISVLLFCSFFCSALVSCFLLHVHVNALCFYLIVSFIWIFLYIWYFFSKTQDREWSLHAKGWSGIAAQYYEIDTNFNHKICSYTKFIKAINLYLYNPVSLEIIGIHIGV